MEYPIFSLKALGMHFKSFEDGAAENMIERTIKRHVKNIISFIGCITLSNNKKKSQILSKIFY